MYILRTIVIWGWSPILITVLALLGYIYEWAIWVIVPVLVVILVIGLLVAIIKAKDRQVELLSLKLRELAGYFNRRFMGSSSLSIFVIIDSLFNIDNPKLWDWARACDMSQRIFDTWCSSFIGRLESDIKTRRFTVYLHTYLNELWLLNNRYYEFIEQFHEIAQNVEIPRETVDQYNRLVMEYNTFVHNFRDTIAELKKTARTEVEPPSVKEANEFSGVKPLQASQDEEEKPSQATRDRGYYL